MKVEIAPGSVVSSAQTCDPHPASDDRKLALTLATQFGASRTYCDDPSQVIEWAGKFLEFLRADKPEGATEDARVVEVILSYLDETGGRASIPKIMEYVRGGGFYCDVSQASYLELRRLINRSRELRFSTDPGPVMVEVVR